MCSGSISTRQAQSQSPGCVAAHGSALSYIHPPPKKILLSLPLKMLAVSIDVEPQWHDAGLKWVLCGRKTSSLTKWSCVPIERTRCWNARSQGFKLYVHAASAKQASGSTSPQSAQGIQILNEKTSFKFSKLYLWWQKCFFNLICRWSSSYFHVYVYLFGSPWEPHGSPSLPGVPIKSFP